MYKFFGLVLLSALAAVGAVGAKRVNINSPLDSLIEQLNDQQRKQGTTSAIFPEIPLDSKVKYSEAAFLGADSLKRTADCWQEVKGNDILFDISYGFGLMTIVLPHLEVAGRNMSAYARIRDNSVHISYTMHIADKKCHVKLNEFRVEKMENVEFGASSPEYDGTNLDGFFKLVVIPKMNGIFDSYFAKIETGLQALCNVKDFPNAVHVKELVKSLL